MTDRVRAAAGAAVGFGLAVGLYAWLVERSAVVLDHYTVPLVGDGLPPEGLTVLHLSDLHLRPGGRVQERKLRRLRDLLAGEQYDLLLCTGDLIHNEAGFPMVLDVLAGLRPRLGGFSCPGNHDYTETSVWGLLESSWNQAAAPNRSLPGQAWHTLRGLARFVRKVLRNERVHEPVATNDVVAMNARLPEVGITPLVNRSAHVQAEGVDLWVAGVDDLTEGHPDLAAALADVPAGATLILLAHNPDAWLDPRVERAQLVLSGHTHGGQMRLPLVGAIHTQGTHLSRREPAGWFRRGDTRMFVSRGAGESLPLRFRARPQIALLHLISAPMSGNGQ